MTLYYGIDSDTIPFPCSSADFYIGKLGQDTAVSTSFPNTYFQDSPATKVGSSRTYGYWVVKGPVNDPNYIDSLHYTIAEGHAYGYAQAQAAIQSWNNCMYTIKLTIFADVEWSLPATTNGWITDSTYQNLNQVVLDGFISGIVDGNFNPGLYTGYGPFDGIMGTSYWNNSIAVLWGSNWPNGTTFKSCPTSFTPAAIHGHTPTIWQYYGETGQHDDTVTGDADVAISLPV